MLCQLLYYSEMKRFVDARMIDGIVASADAQNRAHGITGALIAQSGYFLQLLEGRRLALSALFARICNDERHANVTLMSFSETHLRWFSHWNMADISDSRMVDEGVRVDSGEIVGFEPPKLSSHQALDLFMNARAADRASA